MCEQRRNAELSQGSGVKLGQESQAAIALMRARTRVRHRGSRAGGRRNCDAHFARLACMSMRSSPMRRKQLASNACGPIDPAMAQAKDCRHGVRQ
jgi:hypothetical protein